MVLNLRSVVSYYVREVLWKWSLYSFILCVRDTLMEVQFSAFCVFNFNFILKTISTSKSLSVIFLVGFSCII